jgi:membrane-bound metal-dependent hydrolase YbcI (DUF457 family)
MITAIALWLHIAIGATMVAEAVAFLVVSRGREGAGWLGLAVAVGVLALASYTLAIAGDPAISPESVALVLVFMDGLVLSLGARRDPSPAYASRSRTESSSGK